MTKPRMLDVHWRRVEMQVPLAFEYVIESRGENHIGLNKTKTLNLPVNALTKVKVTTAIKGLRKRVSNSWD